MTPDSDDADTRGINPESFAGSGVAEAGALLTRPIEFSRWVTENVDFEYIGMNPGNPQPTELMLFCSAIIGTAALASVFHDAGA